MGDLIRFELAVLRKALLLLIVAIIMSNAFAASFDCSKASTFVEKTICADEELSSLDVKLADAYNTAIAGTSDKVALRDEQRLWLRETRDKCNNVDCLNKVYRLRIAILEAYTRSIEGVHDGITGIYKAESEDDHYSSDLKVVMVDENTIYFSIIAVRVIDESIGNVRFRDYSGEANLSDGRYIFTDDYGAYTLWFRFLDGKVEVEQDGDGLFVLAGDYSLENTTVRALDLDI